MQAPVREDGLTQRQVGEMLGRDKSWGSRRLAMLEKLSDDVREELGNVIVSRFPGPFVPGTRAESPSAPLCGDPGRDFSVHLERNALRYYHCGARGNQLGLWRIHLGLRLHAAFLEELCRRLSEPPPWLPR